MTERSVKEVKMSAIIVNRKEKKDLITKAALNIFVKKGFARSTISDISKEAGIGKGTIYEYFKNKDEIVVYSFEYFMSSLQVDFEQIILSEKSAIEKFSEILDILINMMNSEIQPQIELMFDFWAEGIKGIHSKNLMLEEMNKFYGTYRKMCTEIFQQGIKEGNFKKNINPENLASILIGMIDGLIVQWALDKKSINFAQTIKTINSVFLQGIKEEA